MQKSATTPTSSRLLARLWALLLVVPMALAGLAVGAAPAFACSCADDGFKQQAARADTIFLGRVRETTEAGSETLQILVLAQRIYKGELDQPLVQVETAASSAACGVGALPAGERYLFLTTGGTTTLCSGTQPATREVVNQAQKQLGLGTVIEPPRPDAHFERVEESAPPELNRVVAPGVAAVLLGVLGLLVVRRRER